MFCDSFFEYASWPGICLAFFVCFSFLALHILCLFFFIFMQIICILIELLPFFWKQIPIKYIYVQFKVCGGAGGEQKQQFISVLLQSFSCNFFFKVYDLKIGLTISMHCILSFFFLALNVLFIFWHRFQLWFYYTDWFQGGKTIYCIAPSVMF